MKKATLREIATSFTTIVFIIISVTGVMLYFHLFNKNVKSLHEILGLFFVAAALIHVFVNWKSMKSYFSKKVFIASIILFTAVSAFFVIDSLQNASSPKGYIIQQVINAPMNDALKVLNINEQDAIAKLKVNGIRVDIQQSIRTNGQINSLSPFEIISIIQK